MAATAKALRLFGHVVRAVEDYSERMGIGF